MYINFSLENNSIICAIFKSNLIEREQKKNLSTDMSRCDKKCPSFSTLRKQDQPLNLAIALKQASKRGTDIN